MRKNRVNHDRRRRHPRHLPTTPHRAPRRLRGVFARAVLSGGGRAGGRRGRRAAHGGGHRSRRAADICRGVGGSRRNLRARTASGCGQRCVVRARSRLIRHPGCDSRHRDHHRPDRQTGRQVQRARAPWAPARRPAGSADSAARTVGGRRPTIHPRRLGRARFICFRSVRRTAVADGRRRVHRIGAAGVRVHRAGCFDRGLVVATGLCGHRRLVSDGGRRGVRHPSRLPALAWASSRPGRRTGYCPTNEG